MQQIGDYVNIVNDEEVDLFWSEERYQSGLDQHLVGIDVV